MTNREALSVVLELAKGNALTDVAWSERALYKQMKVQEEAILIVESMPIIEQPLKEIE